MHLCPDTNAYSAHYKADPVAVALIAAVAQTWLPAVVLGELRLQAFLALPYVAIANVTAVTSRHFAQINQPLRRYARPIPANDLWIAASAMEHTRPLFTFDKHFGNVKDLTVIRNRDDRIDLHS